jgi:Subtilase family
MSLAPGKQPAPREVVIVTKSPTTSVTTQAAAAAAPMAPALNVISAARALGLAVRPLFPDASVHAPTTAAAVPQGPQNPELAAIEREQSRFYVTHAATDSEAQQAAEQLKSVPGVSKVYVKPAVENAPPFAKPPAAPGAIPDYTTQQGYLDPAPGGVAARSSAWALPGGKGAGVRFIDIEGGWTLDHIDLRGASGGLIGGQAFTDADWTNHGTAVLGEIHGVDNGFGVTGIAPEATFSVVSHQGLGSAGAIDLAASSLAAGDIMLLEMHRPGPRFGFSSRDDQQGYIAVEWWPDDFLAVRRAVLRGVIVVEAAGNGAQDLDDPFYDTPDPSFPDTWKNPFRDAADSGAILIGAGAPPSGQFGPDRSRLDFSNFGSRIDCQGWGRGVVTTGYGDLHGGADDAFRTVAYTAEFSGTSSASPIVTGVVVCLQGIARQRGGQLDPAKVRTLLRASGSPQTAGLAGGVAQRIGNRPDLAALIAGIIPSV